MKILSGSSHNRLSTLIAKELGLELVLMESNTFGNGERRIWIKDNVDGESVVVVQSFSNPVDQHIIEFLMITDALERLGARSVYAVIPWMGYSLQDKVFRPGEPIAAKVVANLVSNSFVKRVVLMDLHNSSIPGFFSVPTSHLSANQIMIDYINENYQLDSAVVASPDFGGLKRSKIFAQSLGLDLINISKERNRDTGEVTNVTLGDKVQKKDVFLFDDCVMSGQTVVKTAKALHEKGAKSIHFFATHGVFTQNSKELIDQSYIDKIIVTNSIDQKELPKKAVQLSIHPVITKFLRTWS